MATPRPVEGSSSSNVSVHPSPDGSGFSHRGSDNESRGAGSNLSHTLAVSHTIRGRPDHPNGTRNHSDPHSVTLSEHVHITSQSSVEGVSKRMENYERQRIIHAVPIWAQSAGSDSESDDETEHHPSDQSRPSPLANSSKTHSPVRPPMPSVPAIHHHAPAPRHAGPGRRFDQLRDKTSVTSTRTVADPSAWEAFLKTSALPWQRHKQQSSMNQGLLRPEDNDSAIFPDMEKRHFDGIPSDQESDSWIPSSARRALLYQRIGVCLFFSFSLNLRVIHFFYIVPTTNWQRSLFLLRWD